MRTNPIILTAGELSAILESAMVQGRSVSLALCGCTPAHTSRRLITDTPESVQHFRIASEVVVHSDVLLIERVIGDGV